MHAKQALEKMRKMPLFPIMPFLPLGLMVSSVVLLALVYGRVSRIESKTDQLVRAYADLALS